MKNSSAKSFFLRPFVPRLGYRHIFLEDGDRHSMLHVQNPFSFFAPESPHVARASVRLFDQYGRRLGLRKFDILPFGMLAIDIRELGIDLRGTTLGTISVDLRPPRAYRRYLHKLTNGVAHIASPFWMRFFDGRGSQAFVHAIEADRTRLHGLPWPLTVFGLRHTPSGQWTSSREIRLKDATSASAFVVNHSRRQLRTVCTWSTESDDFKTNLHLRRREVREIEIEATQGENAFLSLSTLATPNAKPYVLVRSRSGLFGLTHG